MVYEIFFLTVWVLSVKSAIAILYPKMNENMDLSILGAGENKFNAKSRNPFSNRISESNN